MRRLIQGTLYSTLLFSAVALVAQPSVDFAFPEGSSLTNISGEEGTKIVADFKGNFFVTGTFGGTAFGGTVTSKGDLDIFLAKYDPNGSLLWVTTIGSPNLESAGDIDYREASGRVFLVGTVRGNTSSQVEVTSGWLDISATTLTNVADNTGNDIYIGQFNGLDGTLISNQVYGGSNNDAGYGISVDENTSDFYVTGTFRGNSVDFGGGFLLSADAGGVDNGFLLKLNSGFTTQWAYGLTSTGNVSPRGIDHWLGSVIAVTGSYENQVIYRNSGASVTSAFSQGGKDLFVIVYNSGGSLQTNPNYEAGSTGNDAGAAADYQVFGDLHLAGYVGGTATFGGLGSFPGIGGDDIFIGKIVGGDWAWVDIVGSTASDRATDIARTQDENIVVTGYIGGNVTFGTSNPISITGSVSQDAFVAKYEQFFAEPLFAIKAGGSNGDQANGIASNDNKAIVTGNFNSTDASFGSIDIASSSGTSADDIFIAGVTDVSKVASYTFSGNANNESGNGLNGTVNGAQLTSDQLGNVGSAYQFDGLDDFISVSDNPLLNFEDHDFSLSAWVKTSNSTTLQRIISKGSFSGSDGYMLRTTSSGTVLLEINGNTLVTSNTFIADGGWHMVTAVLDRDQGAKIYVDGVLDNETIVDTSLDNVSSTTDLTIGIHGTFNEPFDGSIDEVSIFSSQISEEEITDLYSIGSGLIAFYPFNGNANDVPGMGFNGTIQGATLTADRRGDSNSAYDFSTGHIKGSGSFGLEDLTIAGWINPSYLGPGNSTNFTIICERDQVIPDFLGDLNWQFEVEDEVLAFFKKDQLGTESAITTPNILKPNKWQHVAVTYNNTTGDATIYLDGQSVATSILPTGMNNANYPWLMGAAFENGADGFVGDMDEFHIYNYDLPASEIFDLFVSEQGLQHWLLEAGNPDDVVKGYTASLNGVITPTPDRFGNSNAAFFLDGASNYVYSSNSIVGGSDQFSVSAWFYPNFQNDFGTIISENDIGGQGVFYIDVSLDNIGLVTHIDGFTTNQVFTSGEAVKPFEWNHVAVTFDNGNAIIYLNGEESASAMLASPVFDGTSNMIVGSGSLFNGNLDDIRIYDYPLSEEQATDIYYEDGWTGVSTANLRAQYNFAFNTNDDSGNGLDGIVIAGNSGSPVFSADRFGNPNASMNFLDDQGYISIANSNTIDLSTEFTWNAWVKLSDISHAHYILTFFTNTSTSYDMSIDEFAWNFNWDDGSGGNALNGTLSVATNVWTMLTVTVDATNNAKMYLNGVLDTQQAITRIGSFQTGDIRIGGDVGATPTASFDGNIDDISLYDVALSAEDIQALYSVNGWTGDPIILAHWPIDNGSNPGEDISGFGNNFDDEGSGLGTGNGRFLTSPDGYVFDGSNYAVARDSNHPQGEVTVSYSVWEYHDDVSSGILLNVGNQGETNNRSALLMLTPNILYYAGEGNDYQFSTNIPTDRWNHIILTKEGTELNLYLNGQWVEQGFTSPGQYLTNTDIWVGRNNLGSETFVGKIDDIRIFNYVIDESDVSVLFDEGVDTSIPIVQIEPIFASADDEVRLIYNAERGNKGLIGLENDDVYFYSGVITSDPDAFQPWDFVANPDFFDNSVGLMTAVAGETNQWEITLGPQLRDYYGIPNDGTPIYKINMVFRNTDGSAFGNGAPEFGAFPGGYITDGTEFTGGVNSTPGDIYVNISNFTPLEKDSATLVALYQATNGDSWINNTNWLTGPLDTWAGVTVSGGRVTEVFLEGNNLDGTLPASIGQLDACFDFYLSNNNLTGNIPSEMGNLISMQYLDLSENQLDGLIPATFGNLTNLVDLILYDNNLVGSLPDELASLTNLLILDLESNGLNGLIPDYLGSLTGLEELWLNDNDFSGPIPTELGNLFNLTLLDLAQNDLIGTIPVELGNLSNLDELYLADNDLFGEIPSELGNLTALSRMELSYNNLEGEVPSTFAFLGSITYLDLSNNLLEDMTSLSGLSLLDTLLLEYNKFTFEDLLINNGVPSNLYVYAPQELVGNPQNRFVATGTNYEFNSGFDESVTGSSWEWYREGSFVGSSTTNPFINLNFITDTQEGNWYITETNSSFPLLTLQTDNIFLDVRTICTSEPLDFSDTRIDQFVFADIDNTSDPASCAGYTNFTNISATVYPGQSFDFGYRIGTCNFGASTSLAIFVDLDGNGDFSDQEKIVESPSSVSSSDGIFASAGLTIPSDAPLGTFLMRVVAVETDDASSITGCNPYSKGETEDYTVNIVDATADLTIELADVKPNSIFTGGSIEAGGDLSITTIVLNTGLFEVTNLTRGVAYYLSTDQLLDGGDIEIGTSVITSLPGGQFIILEDEVASIPVSVTPGNYYLITFVDPDGSFNDPDTSDNIDITDFQLNVIPAGDSELPVVNLQNVSPYTKGGSGIAVSANITDNLGISSVEFYWGVISDVADDNNDGDYNLVTPEETTTGVYEFTFQDGDFADDLGIQYFFRAYDAAGNSAESSPKPEAVSVEFPSGTIPLTDVSPISSSGNPLETDYRIFSVPVQSISLGDLLGNPTTDKSLWRAFQYNGSNSELSSSSSITAGKGYWLIYQNSAGVSFNAGGVAVNTSNSSPFTISLSSGLNLIGNPYNFPISWQEVIDHNISIGNIADGDVTGLTFYRGSFSNLGNSDLAVSEGAFVQSNGTVVLEIPISSSIFFRTGNNNARISKNSLDKDEWRVPINLANDITAYNVAVVGMHPKAEDGQDKFDLLAMPYLFNYLEFNSQNELFKDRFSGDVVETTDNQIWEFEATTSFDPSDAVLSWDNSYFGDNDRQLFLHDLNRDQIVNMREQQEYHFFLGESKNFRILYGSQEFIEASLQPAEITLGRAYPNPFMNETRIPFNLSTEYDQYKVQMTIYNSVGELVRVLAEDEYSSGFYAADWDGTNEFGQKVSEGIYIYKLSITHENGTDNLTGKLIYGR